MTDEFPHLDHLVGIQAAGRLVQQQDRGVPQERLGQSGPLAKSLEHLESRRPRTGSSPVSPTTRSTSAGKPSGGDLLEPGHVGKERVTVMSR